MFEFSGVMFLDGGEVMREDAMAYIEKNLEGVGIGRCLNTVVKVDGLAVAPLADKNKEDEDNDKG